MLFWSRLSLFWKFQLVGWLVFVIVAFPLKLTLMQGSVVHALFLCLIRDGSSFALTVGMRKIYRDCWLPKFWPMALLVAVVCSVGGLAQELLFLLLHAVLPIQGEIVFTHYMEFNVLYERTGLLFGWSFLYFGMRYAIESIRAELRLALLESEKQSAELKMLKAQMNPHFLFNALTTIHSGVRQSNPRLGDMVQSLADFLRYSLDHSQSDLVDLGHEYDAVQNYLQVENVLRFEGKLHIDTKLDESMRSLKVPGIILQPLVENAVKYGEATSGVPLRIRLQFSRPSANLLQIIVANTGSWVEPTRREKASHLGLQNLRHRLALLYPGGHRLDISRRDDWVTITILIPVL